MHASKTRKRLLWLATPLLLLAAGTVPAWSAAPGQPAAAGARPTTVTEEPNPPASSGNPTLPFDYDEREYFLSGTARTAAGTAPMPYTTRIVVRTPAFPSEFNGNVLVEWYNISAETETAPSYGSGYQEVHRQHYGWVGVSAQKQSVTSLQLTNPVRYQKLSHPGDDYSYDIMTQVGNLLHHPGKVDPLAVLRHRNFPCTATDPALLARCRADHGLLLVGVGQSQSARRLMMYIKLGVEPRARAFDGYFIESAAQSRNDNIGGAALAPKEPKPTVPTLEMQSEGEALTPALYGRQRSTYYREWWVAGAAHVDRWQVLGAGKLTEAPTGISADSDARTGAYGEGGGPGGTCATPDAFPKRYTVASGYRALTTWMRTGRPVTNGPEFQYDKAGALVRDADENVRGGVRLAIMDVPVAGYVGGFCSVLGYTTPFSDQKLRARYATHAQYLKLLRAAIAKNVADRYLLPEDARDLDRRAVAAKFRWEGALSIPKP